MSQIQITNEISTLLANLKNAINAGAPFNKAIQLSFPDNRNFSSATAYRDAIRKFGNLAESYLTTLTGDVENCEQIIENARMLDERAREAFTAEAV